MVSSDPLGAHQRVAQIVSIKRVRSAGMSHDDYVLAFGVSTRATNPQAIDHRPPKRCWTIAKRLPLPRELAGNLDILLA
jgi:hypothetical protein